MTNIEPCRIEDIRPLLEEYLQTLSSPFDSFLEDHILASSFYKICEGTKEIGYYAIHSNELLTQFFLRQPFQMHAQALFGQALKRHALKSLFVSTGDELMISLCLDREDLAMERQAYFFRDSGRPIAGNELRGGEIFRRANADELATIKLVCGDFLPDYERRIAGGELFVYYRGNDLSGIGVIERSRLFDKLGSIGMFVNEACRRQGAGTAVIAQLRKWCAEQGIMPVSGCWYYNEASKRTLEKAGMATRTRLLRFRTPHREE